jgi:hypothetical protein
VSPKTGNRQLQHTAVWFAYGSGEHGAKLSFTMLWLQYGMTANLEVLAVGQAG